MSIAGVTSTGFVQKIATDLVTDIVTQELAIIDPALDTAPDQPIGQINGIMAAKMAELWELGATAYKAFDPDAAEGALLDNICAITGTKRLPAKPSTVTCNVTLNAGATLPIGSQANVAGVPTSIFLSSTAVTNTGGSPAVFPVVFLALNTGATVATAGTLTVITAPVTGWTAVTNPLDATLGYDIETDTALRIRRNNELSAAGGCSPDAIRADLLRISGVLNAFVFENTTLLPDVNFVPGKALECVVYDGAGLAASNATIAATLWKDKPSGIQLVGNTSATTLDSQGNTRTVNFSRPTLANVYLAFTVTTDSTFPSDGIAQIKAAVALYGNQHLGLGGTVYSSTLKAAALTIKGVLDVPSLALDFVASPTLLANLTTTGRQLPVLDTSRITVNGL